MYMYNIKIQYMYLLIVLFYKCMYIINDFGYYMCNFFMIDVYVMDCQLMVNFNINSYFINY